MITAVCANQITERRISVYTSHVQSSLWCPDKGLETRANDYITKPFQPDELELGTTNLLQLQSELPVPVTSIPGDRCQNGWPWARCRFPVQAMATSRSTLNRKLKSLLYTSPNDLIPQYQLQKATGYPSAGMDMLRPLYDGLSSHSYLVNVSRNSTALSHHTTFQGSIETKFTVFESIFTAPKWC